MVRVDWSIYERCKKYPTSIVICVQNIFPNNWKLIYQNHDSKFEKMFPTLDETREFIEKNKKFVFYKGKFVTRREMAELSKFKNDAYPNWFRAKIIREVVEKKQSAGAVSKKFNINNVTIISWLKNNHIYKTKYGNGRRYGEWKKI